jgi:hypothetical protein
MANVPISNLTTTWNNVSTTFTGIKLNVTDTASAAASKLLDLQVGGVSKISASKGGEVRLSAGTSTNVSLGAVGTNSGILFRTATLFEASNGTNTFISAQTPAITISSTMSFSWSAGFPDISSGDLSLFRDAANTLAQRFGVNAQTFRLYNTFTDASNYERGKFEWASNVLQIGSEKAGTGSARNVAIQTDGTARATFSGFGVTLQNTALLDWSGRSGFTSPADGVISMRNAADNAGSALQFREQTAPAAPATDNVRIYAEDNGSGKTRLMARFATGAAVQIAIEP